MGQFYADKNHTKISCEYSTIKCWLGSRDILCIQKISDARTIKTHWLRTKTSLICADKNHIKISNEYVIKIRCLANRPRSSYNESSKWLQSKKTVINLQKKDGVIAALHHVEIKHHPERISLQRPYEIQYHLKGLEFPVPIKNIDNLEKNNLYIAVDVLFSKKKRQNIYTVLRSGRNVKCKK